MTYYFRSVMSAERDVISGECRCVCVMAAVVTSGRGGGGGGGGARHQFGRLQLPTMNRPTYSISPVQLMLAVFYV